jgi:hypothetical protein
MRDQLDLVGLLYRADWTRLSLTAEVSVTRDRDLWQSRFAGGPPPEPPSGSWLWPWPWAGPPGQTWFRLWSGPPPGAWSGPPPGAWDDAPDEPSEAREEGPPRRFGVPRGPRWTGHEWELATELQGTKSSRSTLLIAPGRRYRQQGDGHLSGCDGDRSWHAVEDDGWTVVGAGGPEPPPVARLLRPSWLLTGFTLEPGELASVSGRDALQLTAAPKPGLRDWPVARRLLDRVEATVDAELGILLRYEEILDGRPLCVTELTDVRVDFAPVNDDAQFQPPDGWDSVDDSARPSTPKGPGWEVAKLAGGLAAGGLGALIRSSPFRPFEQATQEEAEAEMPAGEGPLPADGLPTSDEMLHRLHASPDRWAPGITATLHQWHDDAAMLARIPDGARQAGFGGLGLLIDAAGERIATVHTVARLSLNGSGQYRIEPVLSPGRPARSGRHRHETVICDGERRWRIGDDEVIAGPAVPLPREIANLLDASWLLEHELTGGAEILTGGRRGYRLKVASGEGPWGGLFFPDEVVVDEEFGILLGCISFSGSRPVMRSELRDVVVGPSSLDDFRPDIPEGMRVVEEPDDEPPRPVNLASVIAREAAKEARSAVKSFLGVIRGEDTR